MKISENTRIGELLARHPETAMVFYEHGFACLGCQFAAYETIGEGATAHGMGRKKMLELIKNLNDAVEKEGKQNKMDEWKGKERKNNAAERNGTQNNAIEWKRKEKRSNAVGKKKEKEPGNAVKRKKEAGSALKKKKAKRRK